MAQRVPLSSPEAAIAAIEADGGVILTGFASPGEIEQVNQDAKPYLEAIIKDVRLCILSSEYWTICSPFFISILRPALCQIYFCMFFDIQVKRSRNSSHNSNFSKRIFLL